MRVVKDQKRQLAGLAEQNNLALTIYEEKSAELERQGQQLTAASGELTGLREREARAGEFVRELQATASAVQRDHAAAQAELARQVSL
ncbi:hypothetical protein HK405_002168 [Cladochytrium tenue]|nr:hypothetical protein HK405_002168 [Cladochytrium tenue]